MKYLIYLAEQGKGNLHPHGESATGCLINALKIESGDKILEIGCGTGETLVRILSTNKVTIDATDVLPEMLEKASRRLKITGLGNRCELFRQPNNDELPFRNRYYDKVYAESVLGFQKEEFAIKLLAQIHRVLTKDGLFAANEAIWKKNTPLKVIEEINISCVEDFGLSQASEQPWFIDEWNNAFSNAGFEILSCDLISDILGQTNKKNLRKNFRMYLSKFLTNYLFASSLLSPSLRRKTKNFKNLLSKHADDGKYIEARLFVMKKNKHTRQNTKP